MYFGFSAFLTAALVRWLGGLVLIILVAIPARTGSGSLTVAAFELAIPLCLFIELGNGLFQERKHPVPPNYVTVPVLAFYMLALASGYWAADNLLWLNRVVVLSEALAAGWAVYLAVSRLGTQVFLRIMAWSATGGAAWALIWFYLLARPLSLNLQPPTGANDTLQQSLRLGSPLLGPSNYYASFLILSIPATFYLCREKPKYWLLLTVQVAAFIATLSRGGVIALVVASAIVLTIGQVHSRRLPNGLAVVSVAIVAVVLVPQVPIAMGALLSQRRETTLTGEGFNGRTPTWQMAIELWRTHPYFGIGEGTWNAAVPVEYFGQAHNVLLQILAELGIFGLLTAIFAFCAILVASWRIRDTRLRLCLLAALLGSFIDCLTEATFEGAVFAWFLGVFLGGLLATSTKDREKA